VFKQVIIMRTDLKMGKGKLVAQGSHACLDAFLKAQRSHPDWAELWHKEGMKKIVLKVDSEAALIAVFEEAKRTLPAALIIDAGHTQVEPGTKTAVAIGPAPEMDLDRFTSRYKLL
jgi:PTH2 family peptidyl-tRNA hydrolase